MKKIKILLIINLLIIYSQVQNSLNEVIDKKLILKKISEKYKTINTYNANFFEYSNGFYKKGKIKFKKPNFISVKYYRGNTPYIIIKSDDKMLYIYLVRLHIVTEQELNSDTDTIKKEDNFNIYRLIDFYKPESITKQNLLFTDTENRLYKKIVDYYPDYENPEKVYFLKMIPKNVEMGLTKIYLWIKEDGTILRAKFKDINNPIDMVFFNIELNKFIPEKEFEFDEPANVQIYKNNIFDKNKEKEKE